MLQKWALAHFYLGFERFLEKFLMNFWVLAHFFGFWPTFENESGPRKMPYLCGFQGFWPTFPLFFFINCEKK